MFNENLVKVGAEYVRKRMDEVEAEIRRKAGKEKYLEDWQLKNRIREGLKKELVTLGILDGKLWP